MQRAEQITAMLSTSKNKESLDIHISAYAVAKEYEIIRMPYPRRVQGSRNLDRSSTTRFINNCTD